MISLDREEFIKGWHLDVYRKLVAKAIHENRNKGTEVYYEAHHILPKSIFPEFTNLKENPDNLVLFTPREHFISHMLLLRFMRSKNHRIKMNRALCKFCHQNYTSKLYHIEKIRLNREGFSEEHRRKIGIASAKKIYTEEYRRKLSQSGKGRIVSSEVRMLFSRMYKGKRPSENTIAAATIRHSKEFSFISPDGNIHSGINLRKFCRDNNLHQAAMNGVRLGVKPHYKQWRRH